MSIDAIALTETPLPHSSFGAMVYGSHQGYVSNSQSCPGPAASFLLEFLPHISKVTRWDRAVNLAGHFMPTILSCPPPKTIWDSRVGALRVLILVSYCPTDLSKSSRTSLFRRRIATTWTLPPQSTQRSGAASAVCASWYQTSLSLYLTAAIMAAPCRFERLGTHQREKHGFP